MKHSFDLEACISGSFKFKPEIDALHDDFADLGVNILEPTKGWTFRPNPIIAVPHDIHPLPDERWMPKHEIENRFLAAMRKSDFLYVYCPEGYIGTSVAIELGFALADQMSVYAHEDFTAFELADGDLATKAFIEGRVAKMSLEEIVKKERERKYGSMVL